MEKGTLVRVKDDEALATGDWRAVQWHGRLWLFTENTNNARASIGDPLRAYKSLADGVEFCWFDSQVEEAPDE